MNYVNKYLSDVQSVLDEINIIANETNNSKLIRLVEIGNYYSDILIKQTKEDYNIIEQLKSDIDYISNERDEYNSNLQNAEGKIDDLESEVSRLENTIMELEEK